MWTPWPSAPPTPRHGSWSCRSGRRRGDAGAPLGRCTRWRPPRNRRCSSRQSGFRTPSCRSSSPSAWRESAGVAGSATHRRRGGAATGRSGAGGHGALGPAAAEGRARERVDAGGVGRAGRPGAPATGNRCGRAAAGRGGAAADRSALRLKGGGRERGGADGGTGGRGAAAVSGLRVPAAGERTLPREGRAGSRGRAAVLGRGGRRDLAGRRVALLCRRHGARAGARGASQARVRASGGEGGAGVRRDRGHRLPLGTAGGARLTAGGRVFDGGRSAARGGARGTERDEPYSGEFFRDAMNKDCVGWGVLAAALLVAACGGARGGRAGGEAPLSAAPDTLASARAAGDSLAVLAARTARDSAADQRALDSLRRAKVGTDTLADRPPPVAPQVKGEEVEREAVRLFGPEGRTAIGAAPSAQPTFDIDVSTFATNHRVLEYLEFFQVDSHDRFEIWLSRLGRYEGMIRERLRAKRLPEDLVYLTLIESGLSNTAVSRARAVGMWQFMASTARLYGLTVDPWVDERRDPFKATEAAVNYLADLRERLGSVYLAAAAYNAGVGRIERGIGRLPGAGGRGGSGGEADSVSDLTFFQLADRRYLRRETRDYVPKLIAASLIAKQPGRYGFDEIKPLPPLAFDEISIADATGLDVIARLADTSVAAILELNPQFVRGVTPPGRVVVLRVPRGRGTHVAERYDSLPVTERITFVDHYVSRGQTLSEIAKRYRVNVAMIESANPRLKAHALRVGQRIIIPMSGRVVPAAAWSIPPESRYRRVSRTEASTGSYRVRTGETASEIARRYGVPLTALLNYNGLTLASVIRAGDVIKIPQK